MISYQIRAGDFEAIRLGIKYHIPPGRGKSWTQTCLFGRGYVCWFPGRFPQKTTETFFFWDSFKAIDHQIYVDSTIGFNLISMNLLCFPIMAELHQTEVPCALNGLEHLVVAQLSNFRKSTSTKGTKLFG